MARAFPGFVTMKIQIIMGSKSDMPVAEKAKKILEEFAVEYDITEIYYSQKRQLLLTLVVCMKV